MVKKQIALSIYAIVLLFGVARAQDRLDEIVPLVSVKKDVVKIFGEPSNVQGPASYVYDLGEQVVKITFYNGGCTADVEKDLRLMSGTVIEVKRTPRKPLKAKNFLPDTSDYESYIAHGGEKLYYQSAAGIVTTTRTENSKEFIKSIFRIGPPPTLDECLSKSLDDDSAQGELHYFGAIVSKDSTFNFPPVQVGGYFDEDPESDKREIITEFVEALSARKNAVGLVRVNGAESDPTPLVERRTAKLLGVLKKERIGCAKLVIENRSRGGLSGASFTVVHESFVKGGGIITLCH